MAITEGHETEKPTKRFAGLLQSVISGGIVMGAGLYIVGLLIVNFNLAQYGLISLNLARAEYAMAGALWCFLIAVIWGGVCRRFRRCQ